MTSAELQEIKARCDAATPIPILNIFDGQILKIDRDALTDSIADIPALLAHIEAQRNALAEADKAVLVEALERCVCSLDEGCEHWQVADLLYARAALARVKESPCLKN